MDITDSTTAQTGAARDRRIRRTESQLARALGELLRQKPLDSITITELTAKADINRATFYAHYANVRELFSQVTSDQCMEFRILIKQHAEELAHNDPSGVIHDLFVFMTDNAELLTLLGNGEGSLYDDILAAVQEALITYMVPLKNPNGHFLDVNDGTQLMVFRYQINFIAGGLTNLMHSWFAAGRKESIETMTVMANAYVRSLGERSYLNGVTAVEALPGNDR